MNVTIIEGLSSTKNVTGTRLWRIAMRPGRRQALGKSSMGPDAGSYERSKESNHLTIFEHFSAL